jgi:hypothetical protein
MAAALGWSERLAWRWSAQLLEAGWARRIPMTYGQGSLLLATAAGVEMAGVAVRAPRSPAPTWWRHLVGCAWTSAWLTARGRAMQGPREVDVDASWRGQLRWRDSRGRHAVGHRPDLAWLPEDGRRVAIEVELARKSTPRLEAILALHGRWCDEDATAGVIYVCAGEHGRARITDLAAAQNLSPEPGGGLRVELLDEITAQATLAGHALREQRQR